MATSLAATISAGVIVQHSGTGINNGLGSTVDTINKQFSASLSGAGGASNATGVCDLVYSVSGTIGHGSSTTMILGSGSTLKDAFGSSVNFARIKTIYIANKLTSDQGSSADAILGVGAAGTNPLASIFGDISDVVKVPPGGVILLSAPLVTGFTVTASSSEQLKIANPSSLTDVPYEVVIVGTAA